MVSYGIGEQCEVTLHPAADVRSLDPSPPLAPVIEHCSVKLGDGGSAHRVMVEDREAVSVFSQFVFEDLVYDRRRYRLDVLLQTPQLCHDLG